MIAELAVTAALYTDPINGALDYLDTMNEVAADKPDPAPTPDPERVEDATAAARSGTRLPPLLATIRAHESGGFGAYQFHGRYMGAWATRYGHPEVARTPATQWSPTVQDDVALGLFYSTNPDGDHWCRWTTYC
jgi:hypothetical protein